MRKTISIYLYLSRAQVIVARGNLKAAVCNSVRCKGDLVPLTGVEPVRELHPRDFKTINTDLVIFY